MTPRRAANLIRKYSREGVVEREFLTSGMLPHGENATSPERGDSQLWVEGRATACTWLRLTNAKGPSVAASPALAYESADAAVAEPDRGGLPLAMGERFHPSYQYSFRNESIF
jgi:hypothetical protein